MKIKIENLCFRYQSFGAGTKPALDQINLQIDHGEFLALVGPSGSGKTTLMQQFTALLKPDAGRVLVDGVDIWAKCTSLARLRSRIGLVFQFPETQLFEETVYDDVAFGPKNLGCPQAEIGQRVRRALSRVGLEFDKFKDRSPIYLSEGEKRRVAIAGTLAMDPECLILDEPSAGLDSSGVRAMTQILREFHAQQRTVLIISHNLDLVASLVQRIILICDGKICFDGPKRTLFGNRQILERAGLSVPRVVPIVEALHHLGCLDSEDVYSIEEIKRGIAAHLTS